MKKTNYMKVLAALLLVMAAQVNVMAQNRKIDLEIKLVTPAANAVIANGQQAPLSVTIKNNGPDVFKNTDTIAYKHSLMAANGTGIVYAIQMPGGSLASGATMTVDLEKITNDITTAADKTLDFCVELVDINTANLKASATSPTIKVSWDEQVTTNNKSCASITLKGKPQPNSIFDVAKNNETLVMGPNPANSEVAFLVSLETARTLTAAVRDIQGREILKKDFGRVASGNNTSLKLDVSGLRNGIYFVELNGAEKKSVGKLVVQH